MSTTVEAVETTGSPVDLAVQDLTDARARVAGLVAEQVSLERQADELEQKIAGLMFEDPAAGLRDADEVDRLRRRAGMLAGGARAGRARVKELRAIALRAQAAALEPDLARVQEALRVFDERTEELRAALTAHTKLFWSPDRLAVDEGEQVRVLNRVPGALTHHATRDELAAEVVRASDVIATLEAAAAGDLNSLYARAVGELPATHECLLPGGWADPDLDETRG